MKRNSTELKVKYHGNKTEKSKGRKKNPNVADISKQGYRDDSPYRSMPSIDIHTPNGIIDMSSTGIPLWANGQLLQPYSGQHFIGAEQVKEIPLAKTGGWLEQFQGDQGPSEVFKPSIKHLANDFFREREEIKQKELKNRNSVSINIPPMVAESTDTPAVRLRQQAQIREYEQALENKPIARKEITPINYSKKINEYATKEDKEVIDKYYKKYDKSNQDAVKAIQTELVANNFLPNEASIDGKFGDKTKAAFLKYKALQRVGDLSGETSKSSCTYDGCAEYVSSVTRPYGWVLGDAWEMKNNIETNGGTIKYNIYEDARFSNVKNIQNLKNTTRNVKKNNKASADMFQIGDVVGLYNESSDMHATALKDGRGTYNTHVGVITDIKDGVPIISHNIHGKLHHDPYNSLTIGWIGTPASKVGQYKPKKEPKTLEEKINVYSNDLTNILAPGLNSNLIADNVKGILRLETGLGYNKPSESDIATKKALRFVLGESTEEADISRGIGKLKTSSIPDEMRYFLGIEGDDVSDDAGIKAAIYKYIDAYTKFKKYGENNPQLGLRDDDYNNMALLAYNQGTQKLLNIGYNNPQLSIDDEINKLRSLYRGNVKDISSTNYKYLPELLGRILYEAEYPEGHPTYISRVNRYGATPLNTMLSELEAAENEKNERQRLAEDLGPLDKKKTGGWLQQFQVPPGEKKDFNYYLNQARNQSAAASTTNVAKPVIVPVDPKVKLPVPPIRGVDFEDERVINPVTKKPIEDKKRRGLEGVPVENLNSLINQAKVVGIDPADLITTYLRETPYALTASQDDADYYNEAGHVIYGNKTPTIEGLSPYDEKANIVAQAIKSNLERGKRLYPEGPAYKQYQAYQGYGKLFPETEIHYYKEPVEGFFGLKFSEDMPYIDTKVWFPHGKTFLSERDSIVIPALNKYGIKYKKTGGPLTKHQVPPGQINYNKPVSQQDSVRNMAYKTMLYEQERGSSSGTGLSDFGNPNLPPGANIDDAVNWYMKNTMSKLEPGSFNTAMEKAEAGDFIYNAGRDPRIYMLDQYLKSIGQPGLPNRSTFNIDMNKNPQDWANKKPELDALWKQHYPAISKLSTNSRRILLNKGRDWYYQNIERGPGSINEDLKAYKNTWYGRIWNTNDYEPYIEKNPRFTPRKIGGSKLPVHLPEAYKTGGWLKEFQVPPSETSVNKDQPIELSGVEITAPKLKWWEKLRKYLRDRTPGLVLSDIAYSLDHPGSGWGKRPIAWKHEKQEERHKEKIKGLKARRAAANLVMNDPTSVMPGLSPDWRENLYAATAGLSDEFTMYPELELPIDVINGKEMVITKDETGKDVYMPLKMYEKQRGWREDEEFNPVPYIRHGVAGLAALVPGGQGVALGAYAPELIESFSSIPLQAKEQDSFVPYAFGAVDALMMTPYAPKVPFKNTKINTALPWFGAVRPTVVGLQEKKHGGWLKEFE